MLALREVDVWLASRPVLAGVSLDVAKGARVALVGASGGGKSTVLRAALGLVAIARGEIRVFDEVPTDWTAVRRRVGYVIQNGGLFPHLTAAENASLLARSLGRDRGFVDARLAELARLVRLSPAHLARAPHELSGGERQRVALLRALFLDPEMLFLDEPFGALDPIVRADLTDDFVAIAEKANPTVVVVTHDLGEAARLAHEIVVLEAGRIVQRGTRAELERAPATPYVEALLAAARRGAA